MSKGINKVILVGHLGADPETRYTASGAAVCSIRMATTESWKDKETKEKVEKTEWHSVTCFGKLGEIADNYLKKGALIYIEGRLQTDKWQDKDGNDRYTTKVIASDMQMLGGKGDSTAPQANKSNEGGYRQASSPSKAQNGFEDVHDGSDTQDYPF